jgi:DNA-binding Lrp family transcriptional regulator
MSVLMYLIDNCQGIENATHGSIIAEELGISPSKVRKEVKKLRMEQDLIIGGYSKGYFIPRKNEVMAGITYGQRKVISHIETTVNQQPEFILTLYKTLNRLKKELPEAVHNQLEILFDSEEFEEVKRYSELPFR